MIMVRKIAGIMLLLFAAVDVGLPSLCRAEALFAVNQKSITAAPAKQLWSVSKPPSSLHLSQDEGDCFCCCTHIAPSLHLVIQVHPELVSPLVELPSRNPSSGMRPLPYHPPRA